MVEQEAVNFEVTGSSPVVGAIKNSRPFGLVFFILRRLGTRTRYFARQKWFGLVNEAMSSRRSKDFLEVVYCNQIAKDANIISK